MSSSVPENQYGDIEGIPMRDLLSPSDMAKLHGRKQEWLLDELLDVPMRNLLPAATPDNAQLGVAREALPAQQADVATAALGSSLRRRSPSRNTAFAYRADARDDLVQRAVTGDQIALGDLLIASRHELLVSISKHTRSHLEAEEIIAATFETCISRLSSEATRRPPATDSASFAAWLRITAHRRAMDASYRRHRSKESVVAEWGPLVNSETVDGPEEAVVDRDLVRSALSRLPMEYRNALLLSAVRGLSYREIAAQQGVSPNTARNRAHRARVAMRRLLESNAITAGSETVSG